MKHLRNLGASALLALGVVPPSAGHAAYFDLTAYEHAIGGAKNRQVVLPEQSITFTDRYGSFTASTASTPVDTSYIPAGYDSSGLENPSDAAQRVPLSWPGSDYGESGSLRGNFWCHSEYFGCLGADTITYKLPFAVQAISGFLSAKEWYDIVFEIPFFQIGPADFTTPPSCAPQSCYSGFWGRIFDVPTDTITIAWEPKDGGANFILTNAQVVPARVGNNGNGPVPVPAPGGLALMLAGFVGLLGLTPPHAARAGR